MRSSTRLLTRLITAWDARYEDIAGAQRIFVPIASRGVRIDAPEAGTIVFWTGRGTDILDLLQLHGVPAGWPVGRVRWGAHLDHP